ncbi:MAG: F0F1 ATP synthase subunit B [Chloroflexi bacterium]|nr:F0F1 ATP synthase subunit B [Chloroflexota bacterium]
MEKLGINPAVLVAQLVNFLVLFGLLTLVAYRPIMRKLDERSERIKASMDQAEQIKQQNLQAEERMKAQLDSARQEAQKILAQASQMGEKLKEEARVEARREAEDILSRAQGEIRIERDVAIAELRKDVVGVAILAAERVIKRSLDEPAHRRLVEEVMEESGGLRKG